MKNNNILIIGLGNLGCKYLEAVLKVPKIKFIYLFDKKKKIRYILKNKFLNNKRIKVLPNLNYYKRKKFDICIISSFSKGRSLLINFLEKNFIIKNYIIEKILEQNKKKIFDIYRILNNKLENVWVNLPLRTMNLFKKMRNEVKNKKTLIKIKAVNLGMTTNIFHYIDLYSYLIGSKFKDISFNKKSNFEPSKRRNFIEIYLGECRVTFENKSLLIMNCYKTNSWRPKENLVPPVLSVYHTVKNKNKKLVFYIDEILNKIVGKNFQYSSKIKFQYLSYYMISIIKDIIKTKSCELPKLSDIYLDHASITESIINFYNFKYKRNMKCVNIT
jgi:hypothetical protein